jgi:hypothetical protein
MAAAAAVAAGEELHLMEEEVVVVASMAQLRRARREEMVQILAGEAGPVRQPVPLAAMAVLEVALEEAFTSVAPPPIRSLKAALAEAEPAIPIRDR